MRARLFSTGDKLVIASARLCGTNDRLSAGGSGARAPCARGALLPPAIFRLERALLHAQCSLERMEELRDELLFVLPLPVGGVDESLQKCCAVSDAGDVRRLKDREVTEERGGGLQRVRDYPGLSESESRAHNGVGCQRITETA